MSVNHRELSLLLAEANELSQRPTWTKADERRNTFLLSAIAAVKSGASLQEIQLDELNQIEARSGLPKTSFERPSERRRAGLEWQKLFSSAMQQPEKRVDFLTSEFRDQSEGTPKPHYLNGNAGALAPRDFYPYVFSAMKIGDPLLNPDLITLIESDNGRPLQVGYYSDVENVAVPVGENSDQSGNETDIAEIGAVDLGGYSFRSPLYRVSIEALNDVEGMATIMGLFARFAADRCARGVAKYLTIGTGVSQPLGLLTSLAALGTVAEAGVAVGASGNTGGPETGANSIGSDDIATLYYSVNQAYRQSDRCAWICNDSTRQYIAGTLKDKYGSPLVRVIDGRDFLFGKPIYTAPSMASVSSGSIPLVFGDFSFWCTRRAGADRIQLLKEFSGGIEKGEVGLRLFSRWDGALLYGDSNSNSACPIKYLLCHS